MEHQALDPFSQTSYFIELRSDEIRLAKGTCFFVTRSHQEFLITNWHNVTGKDPNTNHLLSNSARIPNNLDVRIFKKEEFIDWELLNINLYDAYCQPVWLEHKRLKQKIDVVEIPITVPSHLAFEPIENMMEPFNETTPLHAGQDVFVLGFPFGISVGGGFPIWKRASIASEPEVDVEDLPKMYIDTASRPEMSGSPVVLKEKRSPHDWKRRQKTI
jgi:hypothetical protein